MATDLSPYINANPGDLITAENWNQLQIDMKQDILAQIAKAVGQIKSVDTAGDAQKLDGKTLAQIEQEILDRLLREIPEHTGYLQLFRRLEVGREEVIQHNLARPPLVDVYQLDYFQVVCATGETTADQSVTWVNFYLYHEINERRIRNPQQGGTPASIQIEAMDVHPFHVPFEQMLQQYKVQYKDATTLDELETNFWSAFFQAPNNEFDQEQYCHSPWFERCCGEQRSVAELKQRGDWPHILFKWHPRKTINYPEPLPAQPPAPQPPPHVPGPAPSQINVVHFDYNTVGITLLEVPDYAPPDKTAYPADTTINQQPNKNDLKVMILMKV